MSALFIADLHLSAATPRTSERLIGLLQTHGRLAQELWILGDLFEVWVGDDTLDDPAERRWLDPILEALASLSAHCKRRLLVGNRDFLLSERFAQATGITLVEEPVQVTVGGVPTLLLHGDTLCTDDLAYQAFRQTVRTPQWKSAFLSKPYGERQQIAAQMRRASQAAGASKAISIMDANPSVARALLQEHHVRRMIHGHTHRPARHDHPEGERLVLTDWDCDSSGPDQAGRGGGLLIQDDGIVLTV